MRDIWDETYDAVLFDNDGTLTDSRAAVERSWLAWADHHGIDRAALLGFHGVPSSSIVRALAPHLDVVAATADIDRRELEDTKGIVALPGAVDALLAVGERTAIVTSATLDLAVLRLEAAGLVAPESVITADDISRGKPDPEPFLVAAARLGVEPARCLVVEDAPAGLRSGRAAGAATLAVTTTSTVQELEPLADAVVTDLSAVHFDRTSAGIRVRRR